ncbi:TetR/AcrR family transcriptional regulator [Streptomyces sp. 2A115]|uniref:TetR/AcrR family transcriptional regulator n=1 Tax=Streptomyces sp. 2A115 TaxID=3457439 RepID=UPI003FD29ECC
MSRFNVVDDRLCAGSASAENRIRRRRDPEASEAAILEAVGSAFAERGDSRAIIREIARRAGVAHGLVMRNCPSREQLVIASMPRAAGPV